MQGIRMGVIAIVETVATANYLWNHCTDFFSKKERMAMYGRAQIKEMGEMHTELNSTPGGEIRVRLQWCEHETKRRSLKITFLLVKHPVFVMALKYK